MKRRSIALLIAGVMAAGVVAAPAVLAAVNKSDNVKLVAHFPYKNKNLDFFAGGTDISFKGKFVYAMQQGADGGIHIFDRSVSPPKKVSFFPCPGEQNDVAVVKKGLLALGYHDSQCGAPGGGVRLIDVRDPRRPKILGAVNDLPGGTHTLTTYPGKPIIYASPGGLPTNGGAVEQILDVSNPMKPKVAATFKPNNSGCHDLSFWFSAEEKLAFCAGKDEMQIWDVSDPLAPVTIGRAAPPTQFTHSVEVTHDGKYMVVGDEAIGGNDCSGGTTGALWIYNIENRTLPILESYFGPPRGQQPVGSSNVDRNTWCSAHLFNFIPGTYTLVASWYSGGMNVIDMSDPSAPTEIAHYMVTGEKKEITNYWSAYWYKGRIWANDRVRGLDVFKVAGLKEVSH